MRDWIPLNLPYLQLWANSLILVLSSVTLETGPPHAGEKGRVRRHGHYSSTIKRDLPWLGITVVLGFCFLAGQVLVWKSFEHQGVYRAFNPSRTLFYIVTGAHAIHLARRIGRAAICVFGQEMDGASKFDSQKIAVEVTGWYWHYLAFLWFAIFALVHFARG